jgi:predicted MFS family arabinose efflux permease
VLVVAALACALATSLQMLAATSLLVGVGATITQILVPFAADLAAPAQRGRAVGTVFSGIMAGILLARTVSGLVGEWLGWRPMFGLASGVALLLAVVLGVRLPTAAPRLKQSYGALLGSMVRLLRQHRALRVACAVQACVFAIFSAFWSILALLLAQEPFHLGPAAAGAFGIVGVVGVAAANASGRLIDRFGTRKVLTLGLGCCVLAWAIFAVDVSLRGLVLGVLVLDFGMSIANVANQTMVLGLDAQARSRINTIYVTAIFLGGSVGTAVASLAWAHGGWPIVCAFGLATALLAAAIHANEGRTKQ